MKVCFILISFLIFTECRGQTKLDGYIHDLNTQAPLKGTRVALSVFDTIKFSPDSFDSLLFAIYKIDSRYDTIYKKLKTTFTDSNGYYSFDDLSSIIYQLSAFHRTKEIRPKVFEGEYYDTSGIKIKDDCNISISFTLYVTCEYDSTKNLTHCPKCKKEDKVLPIRYGLIPYPVEKLDVNYYYSGYCVIERCHPTKHCMRCDRDF